MGKLNLVTWVLANGDILPMMSSDIARKL